MSMLSCHETAHAYLKSAGPRFKAQRKKRVRWLTTQTQNALHRAETSHTYPHLEPDISGRRLEDELSQQRKETASLHEKMDRFERMFSQVRRASFNLIVGPNLTF